MTIKNNVLSWFDLANAPRTPGIYAWYFRPELLDSDINELKNNLTNADDIKDESKKIEAVKSFLRDRIFSFFEQKPYQIELKGQLKPRFVGEATHRADDDLSDELVRRIADDPNRLFELKKALESTSPLQASPLYIGMADDIHIRVIKHKKLITKLENEIVFFMQKYLDYGYTTQEISFAERVVERRIPPTQLFVTYYEAQSKSAANDIENILNRIYFPILGRN